MGQHNQLHFLKKLTNAMGINEQATGRIGHWMIDKFYTVIPELLKLLVILTRPPTLS